jgi:TonB family protein
MKLLWLVGIVLLAAAIFFAPKPMQQEGEQQEPQPVPVAQPKRTQRAAAPQRAKETKGARTEANETPDPVPAAPVFRTLAGGTGTTPGKGGLSATSGPYRPGTGGVGYPSCLYCPDPQYSDDARKAKFEGSVALQAIIQADGHATNIQVVKGAGLGLDEKAVEAVRSWRFKPAVGPNGTSVPTIAPVEVDFHLSNLSSK